MERIIEVQVERLPEGVYLATSDDVPGLVVQGRTLAETLEYARDAAQKLVESYLEHGDPLPPALARQPDLPLRVTIAVPA